MKSLFFSFVVAFCLLPVFSFAQVDSSRKLQFISLDAYLYGNTPITVELSTMQQISRGANDLLNRNHSAYKRNIGYNQNFSAGITCNAGFKWIKTAPNQLTRLSLGVNTFNLANSNYYNDTLWFLKHVQSNSPLYNSYNIVKVKTKQISHSYDVTCLNVGAAHLFYTKRERLLSVYAGVSALVNFSVKSRIHSSFHSYEEARTQDSATGNITYLSNSNYAARNPYFERTTSKAKATGILSIGIPLGVELRFSKHRKKLKHFSFGLELMPQYNYVIIPKLSKQTYFSWQTKPFHLTYRF